MTQQEIVDYCVAKPGAYIDFPFGPEYLVVKVKGTSQKSGRIFAQVFDLKGAHMATLNCDVGTGEFYRSIYPDAVVRGWHCPPVMQPYFNTISLDKGVPDEEFVRMMEHSYAVVTAKLPKYVRRELEEKK